MPRKRKGNRNKDNIIHVNMNDEPTSILAHMKVTDQPDGQQDDMPDNKNTIEKVQTDDEIEIGSDEEIVEIEVEVTDSNAGTEEDADSNQEDDDENIDNASDLSRDDVESEDEVDEIQNTQNLQQLSETIDSTLKVDNEEEESNEVNKVPSVIDQQGVIPDDTVTNESSDGSNKEKTNEKSQDIRVLFNQSTDKDTSATKLDTATQATPETTEVESQTDEATAAENTVTETSKNIGTQSNTAIAVEIDKAQENKNQYVLMGLTGTNNSKRVFTLLGENVRDFQPLNTSNDKLSYNLNSMFDGQFRIPSDPVLTQRTAIYLQSYQSGGICINPAYHRINKNSFQNYFENTKGSVFLFLDKIKPQQRCIQAAKRHGIRGGRPERELQVDGQLFYTKNARHDFWVDVLKLLQRRYNQTVPRGERIDSISKYGRNYLGGADLLTEAYARFGNKYKDVVVVGKDVYNAFFTKIQ
jgi:hypothetical protein